MTEPPVMTMSSLHRVGHSDQLRCELLASIDGNNIVPWALALWGMHQSSVQSFIPNRCMHPSIHPSAQFCKREHNLSTNLESAGHNFFWQAARTSRCNKCNTCCIAGSTRLHVLAWLCMQAREIFWCSPLHIEVWTPTGQGAVPNTSHCLGPQL